MTRAALFTRNQDLATAIAREYFLPGADLDDVHQEARVALWIATGTFDPTRGCSFRTYARAAIKADLRDKVQAANRLKQRVLTDAGRDEQLELVARDDVNTVVEARETLRELASDPVILQRRAWRDAKRRSAAA